MHADRLDVLQGELQARDERLSALERQVLRIFQLKIGRV